MRRGTVLSTGSGPKPGCDDERQQERGDRVNGSAASGRARARWLAVAALLLGLFLMHGSPASAATGCHGVMSGPSSAPMTQAESMAAPTAVSGHASHQLRWSQAGSTGMAHASGMGGELCLSNPARGGLQLHPPSVLQTALLIAAAVLLPASRLVGLAAPGLRAPPRRGRQLLHQACIART